MLVLNLLAFENKAYADDDCFHGNCQYGKILTKKEPIRTTLGLTLPSPAKFWPRSCQDLGDNLGKFLAGEIAKILVRSQWDLKISVAKNSPRSQRDLKIISRGGYPQAPIKGPTLPACISTFSKILYLSQVKLKLSQSPSEANSTWIYLLLL